MDKTLFEDLTQSLKEAAAIRRGELALGRVTIGLNQGDIIMNLSIDLPKNLENQLMIYCNNHGVTENEAVQIALHQFLRSDTPSPTPYELGAEGFGADRTHSGDIARNTKYLLRERFRASAAG